MKIFKKKKIENKTYNIGLWESFNLSHIFFMMAKFKYQYKLGILHGDKAVTDLDHDEVRHIYKKELYENNSR